ncbi:hypothetical protein V6N13_129574 [Hibiscus sabdariffa]|uniref:ARID domain-containing protein n=1 Tax=Hibiscus sabdariffa TaxID=183260 RepID=A0ABR2SLK3_9ROSI
MSWHTISLHYPAALASHEEIVENPVKFHACLKSFQETIGINVTRPRKAGGRVLKFFEFYKWVTLRGGFKEVDQHNRWPELDQNEEIFEIQSPLPLLKTPQNLIIQQTDAPQDPPKTSTFSKPMLLKTPQNLNLQQTDAPQDPPQNLNLQQTEALPPPLPKRRRFYGLLHRQYIELLYHFEQAYFWGRSGPLGKLPSRDRVTNFSSYDPEGNAYCHGLTFFKISVRR